MDAASHNIEAVAEDPKNERWRPERSHDKENTMRKPQRAVVGVSLLVTLTLLIGTGLWPISQASADVDPELTDSLWGESLSPCEEAFGFDPSLRVTIPLHQRERELIHLALEGFIADLEHERVGTNTANPPFELRSGFLGFFIDAVVPTIESRVGGRVVDEFPRPENEVAMLASIQHVEFGACERNAISIAIENWTVKSGGQMAAHLKLCQASSEMKMSTACQSFIPLGDAYSTLSKKIEKDQQ